jgi:GMP synthase (glutamine-hydrolysing)
MKLHFIQHVPYEGIGCIRQWAEAKSIEITCSRLFENQTLPAANEFDLLVVMGGPMGIYDEDEFPWLKIEKQFLKSMIEAGKKIIGICLGAQLLADSLGAKVSKNKYKEIGWFPLTKTPEADDSEFGRLIPAEFIAFHWHGDTFDIPQNAIKIAESEACRNQGFVWKDRVLGLQFHLESTQESIQDILNNSSPLDSTALYVQSPDQMLPAEKKLKAGNSLMADILDKLLAN